MYDGFLPTASVAFLDEIFKANSAILNTLLTVLNERQFDNGAGLREECPIRCVVGASNELPESDELDALYDRFLLRKEFLPVSDEGLMRLLSMPSPGESPCDDDGDNVANTSGKCDVVFTDGLDQVVEALSTAANNVLMGADACALLRDLRNYMREELDVDVSDRRLLKAARLLKISAASHGRISVDPLDCLLLQHVVWRLPEQRVAVREWLWDHLTPGCGGGAGGVDSPSAAAAQFRFVLDGLRREAMKAVRKTAGDVTGSSGARTADVAFIESLRAEAANLATLLQQRSTALARHMELLQRSMDHLWLDADEARAAQQILFPKADAFLLEVDRALADATALELSLSDAASSPSNDVRLSVLELLWDEGAQEITFTSEEMKMGMKEAKAKYDLDTFRMWKRARKKAKA
jgi:MoxR-like ATPase